MLSLRSRGDLGEGASYDQYRPAYRYGAESRLRQGRSPFHGDRNHLHFRLSDRGIPTWRGQQYSLALFPIWIRACTTAARNVWFGRPLDFAVTPKVRQDTGPAWHLIRPQLVRTELRWLETTLKALTSEADTG